LQGPQLPCRCWTAPKAGLIFKSAYSRFILTNLAVTLL
jgi:hypothetical protein